MSRHESDPAQTRLRAARELCGLSQRRLADLAGVKESAVADVEARRVKKPSYEFVTRVTQAFHKVGFTVVTSDRLFPLIDGSDEATV